MRHHLFFWFILLVTFAAVWSFADYKSPAVTDAAQAEKDLRQFNDWLYTFGAPPSNGAIARTVARAKANPDDVRWLFWAGQWGVEGRVHDSDWVNGLRRATEKEYPPAMALYGTVLCGVSERPASDVAGGLELIRRAAAKDDPLAMYQLALAYSAGLPGVPANLERAEALAHRAVDHGMLRSLFVLSKLYQARGDGQKAQQYLARAIDAGDPKAIIMSAQSYMFGSSPDFAKAVDLMRRGALLGDRRCMTEFATALEMQLGGQKRDAVLEQRLLRRAISLGDRNAEAEWALGQVNGSYGIGVDKPTGLAKLQRLAGAGVPGAEMDLGGLLLKGKHVKQDEQAGIALVRQAARHGNPMAKLVLEKRGLAEKQR